VTIGWSHADQLGLLAPDADHSNEEAARTQTGTAL